MKVELDSAGIPYADISEKQELIHRARGAQSSLDDEAFARKLQAEMDEAEAAEPSVAREEPTVEEQATMDADEEMAKRLQAEMYAEDDAEERMPLVSMFERPEGFSNEPGSSNPMEQLQAQMAAMMQRELVDRHRIQTTSMHPGDSGPAFVPRTQVARGRAERVDTFRDVRDDRARVRRHDARVGDGRRGVRRRR